MNLYIISSARVSVAVWTDTSLENITVRTFFQSSQQKERESLYLNVK